MVRGLVVIDLANSATTRSALGRPRRREFYLYSAGSTVCSVRFTCSASLRDAIHRDATTTGDIRALFSLGRARRALDPARIVAHPSDTSDFPLDTGK